MMAGSYNVVTVKHRGREQQRLKGKGRATKKMLVVWLGQIRFTMLLPDC